MAVFLYQLQSFPVDELTGKRCFNLFLLSIVAKKMEMTCLRGHALMLYFSTGYDMHTHCEHPDDSNRVRRVGAHKAQ